MNQNFKNILCWLEFVSGGILLTFSIWLYYAPDGTARGLSLVAAIELVLFSLLVMACGLSLRKFKFLEIPSQFIFVVATVFIYVEFCTSYAGWYSGL